MSLNREYSQMVKEQVRSYPFIHPLQCGMEFRNQPRRGSRWMSEYSYIQQLAKDLQWSNLPELLDPLHNPETAIIITDTLENIRWVNKGFSRMTGYSSAEALGRKPNFLQGKDTQPKDIREVRQQLIRMKPYEGVILNYRKSGEPYYCHISVAPLFNQQQELVNFLAVEKESPTPSL